MHSQAWVMLLLILQKVSLSSDFPHLGSSWRCYLHESSASSLSEKRWTTPKTISSLKAYIDYFFSSSKQILYYTILEKYTFDSCLSYTCQDWNGKSNANIVICTSKQCCFLTHVRVIVIYVFPVFKHMSGIPLWETRKALSTTARVIVCLLVCLFNSLQLCKSYFLLTGNLELKEHDSTSFLKTAFQSK